MDSITFYDSKRSRLFTINIVGISHQSTVCDVEVMIEWCKLKTTLLVDPSLLQELGKVLPAIRKNCNNMAGQTICCLNSPSLCIHCKCYLSGRIVWLIRVANTFWECKLQLDADVTCVPDFCIDASSNNYIQIETFYFQEKEMPVILFSVSRIKKTDELSFEFMDEKEGGLSVIYPCNIGDEAYGLRKEIDYLLTYNTPFSFCPLGELLHLNFWAENTSFLLKANLSECKETPTDLDFTGVLRKEDLIRIMDCLYQRGL